MGKIKVPTLKELTFFPAYVAKRRTGIQCPKTPGVYFIREDGVLVYVGYSGTDVKKALYRHFQKWGTKRNPWIDPCHYPPYDNVTYHSRLDMWNYTVSVYKTDTKDESWEMEKRLIRRLKPRDNREKYSAYFENKKKKEESFIEAMYEGPPMERPVPVEEEAPF